MLVIGAAPCRAHVRTVLSRHAMEQTGFDDAYAAAVELCRRPLAYRALVLCLNSVYREELGLITLVKQRMKLRHIDVYLSQTDGRQAATAEGMRRGADGLLAEDGLHRFDDDGDKLNGHGALAEELAPQTNGQSTPRDDQLMLHTEPDRAARFSEISDGDAMPTGDAVLTTEELRALLQEQPPASGRDI